VQAEPAKLRQETSLHGHQVGHHVVYIFIGVLVEKRHMRGVGIMFFHLTPGPRTKLRYWPDASIKATLKSSSSVGPPVTLSPDAVVTVTVSGCAGWKVRLRATARFCGNTTFNCRLGGSYLLPMCARSPVVEWQRLHPPAPLKKVLPAWASPTRMFSNIVIRAGPQSVADLLVQKMRQVHDLFLRQHHWLSRWMALREIRSDRASVAVMKNHYGPHQVGPRPPPRARVP